MRTKDFRKAQRWRPPREAGSLEAPRRAVIDTSKMNRGQREAMEVAESARETTSDRASFAGDLFLGRFDRSALDPFPVQPEQERRIGDEMVEKVSEFLRRHHDPEQADETRTIPEVVVLGLRGLGVFRMKVPVEYGGLGFSQVNYNRVLEAIASYCGSTAVLVSAHQSIGVPQPLRMFGTAEQKEKYLRRISGGALSGFALTEPEVGSDPARMTTTAKRSPDGDHYLLNGEKLWTTNGPIADLLVVMAQTDSRIIRGRAKRQISAFIVEADSPGVEVVHRCDFMGLRAIHNGVIRFTNVRVPAENLLLGEGKGLRLALKTLNTGRLTLPAACVGISKQCLAIAREWAGEREQWGLPIGRHEAVSAKIAAIASTTFAMEAVSALTSGWADEGRDIRIEAAMAKLFCSEAGWWIIDETVQIRGGRGYERAHSLKARGETPYPVERMMRDNRINRIIEGTSEIMRLYLAREALDPHLTRAADLLSPDAGVAEKLRCGAGLMGHYAWWYPWQIVAGGAPAFGGRGDGLARHERYIRRSSHRLAAAMFRAMARHGPKLERRQILLGHLVEIGVELFVMATTCAYARTNSEHGAAKLADVFCRQSRQRIGEHFRRLRSRDQKHANAIAHQVLDGEFVWLERGIIRNGAVKQCSGEATNVSAVV